MYAYKNVIQFLLNTVTCNLNYSYGLHFLFQDLSSIEYTIWIFEYTIVDNINKSSEIVYGFLYKVYGHLERLVFLHYMFGHLCQKLSAHFIFSCMNS
jgi:hypothetical protein